MTHNFPEFKHWQTAKSFEREENIKLISSSNEMTNASVTFNLVEKTPNYPDEPREEPLVFDLDFTMLSLYEKVKEVEDYTSVTSFSLQISVDKNSLPVILEPNDDSLRSVLDGMGKHLLILK